ncbi:hypothetical protein CathTA2_2951 [Caldalkalibacillus thermarum TA2.A1]|uniref:Pilus assembly PilX N-terminal domain-containing protein n=1 Tax=Caldalkalibacillus thermarum (strain TA2.A1) TaxID=986075 RepID=F5LAL6_CALTT|nr:pilus assembly PilX N-terminal domain-containing protein [Caldalkalibacillus thermarum]EGL81588.1 hypothetical protein CathTA2_2951 [Caldalkalibacillus thermarum TA2.A1]QZT33522.1 pilus assembly PilX N-terminal domain-containing protein [Caldalkalibacillus thermarum TA2.A1]
MGRTNNMLKAEAGSALVLTLLMVLIVTVLGLTLIRQTISGAYQTELREADVQAQYMAESGVEYFMAYIQNNLAPLEGLEPAEFEQQVLWMLGKFQGEGFKRHFDGGQGSYHLTVLSIEQASDDPDVLTRHVKLKSKGYSAKNSQRPAVITATVAIGARQIPDALDYALGAYNPCAGRSDGNCANQGSDNVKGEGNLFLHGGVSVVGDLYVENNLITKNKGIIDRGTNWVNSDFPSIESPVKGVQPRLALGNELYIFQSDTNYQNHINREQFNTHGYIQVTASHSQAFAAGYAPRLVQRLPDFTPVHITGEKQHYYYSVRDHAHLPNVQHVRVSSNGALEPRQDYGNVLPFRRDCFLWWCDDNYNTNVRLSNGNYTFNRLAVDGDLRITGNTNSFRSVTFKEGLYVAGDLIIGNESTSDYIPNYDKLEIRGPIYVGGNLKIQGANVRFDSVIYVEGKTEIRFASLEGIREQIDGETVEKSLVLFGQGDILIANINVFRSHNEQLNRLRGFFYSEGFLEMYGVGSNLQIEGGVFGRKVVLNATKGDVHDRYPGSGYFSARYNNQNVWFRQDQPQLPPELSRLRIVYNPELIKNPPQGMPKVEGLEVKLIERRID